MPLVEDIWHSRVSGDPLYVLYRKLKMVKAKLKAWSSETTEVNQKQTKTLKSQLRDIQIRLQINPFDPTLACLENIIKESLKLLFNLKWQT